MVETNNRRCEICGKNDIECLVMSSSLGGGTFNYCLACACAGAEPSGMKEVFGGYITYNSNDDCYYDESDNLFTFKVGENSFKSRKEYKDWLENNE